MEMPHSSIQQQHVSIVFELDLFLLHRSKYN